MTARRCPPGADAVVMVERTAAGDGDAVEVARRRSPPGDARPAGRRGHRRRRRGLRRRHRARPRPPRRAGQRRRARRSPSCPGPGSACCPPATSWSTAAAPLGPARSATPTGPRCWPCVRRAGCEPVDLGLVARRRGGDRPRRCATAPADVRRRADQRRRQHGRLRLREGGARPHRRRCAGCRSPSGRPSRSPSATRRRHAGVRPARQPGVVDGVASSCSPGPACASMAGRTPTSTGRRCAAVADDGLPPPARRQDALRPGASLDRRRRPPATCPVGRRPGLATSSRPWPPANGLAVLPDGDGVERRATTSRCCSSATRSRWAWRTPVAWPDGHAAGRPLRARRTATCASRSPTAATSAAPTACRRRA